MDRNEQAPPEEIEQPVETHALADFNSNVDADIQTNARALMLREELVRRADAPQITTQFRNEAERIKNYLSSYGERYLDAANVYSRSLLDRKVYQACRDFLTTYFDTAGKPNELAFRDLTHAFLSKVDIITVPEMHEAAQNLVENSADKITLYVATPRKAPNWESPFSTTSNEYMAKLVLHYAQQANKNVDIISDVEQLVDHAGVVCVAEDAIYTGTQMHAQASQLERYLPAGARIEIYVARATEEGEKRARDGLDRDDVQLRIHSGRKTIQSLQEALSDEPRALNYVFVSRVIGWLTRRGEIDEAVREAYEYMNQMTLTVTEVRVPDFMSFPSIIADGLRSHDRDKLYPPADDQHPLP